MLKWAIIFLVVGLLLGAFGFTSAEGVFVGIAKILFFLFIAVFVILLVLGVLGARKIT